MKVLRQRADPNPIFGSFPILLILGAPMADPELTVVIPIHNEEVAIERVILAWKGELERLGIDHVLWACDDGSHDRSAEILGELARKDANMHVVSQSNRGHGPTVMRGYRAARGDWVLQVDGDGEIDPERFETLWNCRDQFDLLLGYRVGRSQPWTRRIVSAGTRLTFRVAFGGGMRDPNVPFRLMRRQMLQRHLSVVPANTFAPNLALSGLAVVAGLRVHQVSVQVGERLGGSPSLRRFRLLQAAWTSFKETLAIRWRSGNFGRAR
jgi:glycosyltransferase involved in cell wall biosynthesis